MRRFDREILSSLLDTYERSSLYRGTNQVNRTIAEKITPEKYPFYFDFEDDSYQTLHEQLLALERKGLVTLSWQGGKVGHRLEKVILTLPAGEAYGFLGREEKRSKEQTVLELIDQYARAKEGSEQNAGEEENEDTQKKKQISEENQIILTSFLSYLKDRLLEGSSIKAYADMDRPEDFARLCTLLRGILENREECYLRELSIRLFQNSKTAEKEIGKAARIIAAFGDGSLEGLEPEEILREYGVVKNPTWILLKGRGCFCREGGGSRVHLEDFPGGVGITGEEVPLLSWDRGVTPSLLITIENLTSFHRFQGLSLPEGYLALYLGGYAAPAQREFLKRLAAAFPDLPRYHFGDMDCGGFLIWKTLVQGTGLSFTPYLMDRETYLSHLDMGQDLSKEEKKRLSRMQQDPFFSDQRELFSLLIEKGRKIEQESIRA